MDERIHLPGFFDRHVLGNVKILDFTGNLGVERGGIEMGNAPDAGASIDDAVPGAVNIVADRADDTQPGNDDTSFHGRLLVIGGTRSEEHTSELQSLMRSSYALFCLKKKSI